MTAFSAVDTFESLIDEVIISLQGFGVEVDQIATLVTDISSTSTTLRLDTGDAITRGLIEIDDELMFVSAATGGVATVPAWGRGFKGTTPASHSAGSPVYISPTFPRSIVSREVNNTIRALYPTLFAVKGYDFITDATHVQYSVPADVDRIIAVDWRWLAIDGWNPLSEWELVSGASSADFATGKFIAVGPNLASGLNVHVTYATAPNVMSTGTDRFAETTGLPASCRDVVVYGAAARLLPWLDSGRLPTDTVSADLQDQQKPVGNAVSVGRELRGLYNTRLQQEHALLSSRYPYRQHRIR